MTEERVEHVVRAMQAAARQWSSQDILNVSEIATAAMAACDDWPVRLNVSGENGHKAADAFWQYWRKNGETHKHGYYESTWGAINAALKVAGVQPLPNPPAQQDEEG